MLVALFAEAHGEVLLHGCLAAALSRDGDDDIARAAALRRMGVPERLLLLVG